MAEMMREYDHMKLWAERTDCDKEGNDLTLGIDGEMIVLTDENDEPLFDQTGSRLLDPESTAVVKTIGGVGLQAETSDADGAGNNIVSTYATKAEVSGITPVTVTITQTAQDVYAIDTTFAVIKAAFDAHKPINVLFHTASTIYIPGQVVDVYKPDSAWIIEMQNITYPKNLSNKNQRWCYAFTATLREDDTLTVNYVEHQIIPEAPWDQTVSPYIAWGRSEGEWVNARAIPQVSVAAAASVDMVNNALNVITGTTGATLTLAVTAPAGEAANFAAQVTPSVNCTLTVTVNSQATLYNKAAGNELEAGKTYQISCLNNCWTMAEFESPA